MEIVEVGIVKSDGSPFGERTFPQNDPLQISDSWFLEVESDEMG